MTAPRIHDRVHVTGHSVHNRQDAHGRTGTVTAVPAPAVGTFYEVDVGLTHTALLTAGEMEPADDTPHSGKAHTP